MLGSEPSFSIWLRRAVETTYSELRSASAISRLASSTWRKVRPKRSRICFRRNPACALRVIVVSGGTVGNDWDICQYGLQQNSSPRSGPRGATRAQQENGAEFPVQIIPDSILLYCGVRSCNPPGGTISNVVYALAGLGLPEEEHSDAHLALRQGRSAEVFSLAFSMMARKAVRSEAGLDNSDGATRGMITVPATGNPL